MSKTELCSDEIIGLIKELVTVVAETTLSQTTHIKAKKVLAIIQNIEKPPTPQTSEYIF